jgi:hypothetical protein
VREAGRHITDPGRGDPSHAARADQLIERDVRDRPDQLEVTSSLPDELVRERERDGRFQRAP